MGYYIYKYTNIKNGKCYIGQTNNINRRDYQHNYDDGKNNYFDNALRAHPEDFELNIICCLQSREAANAAEYWWIEYYDSIKPNGYNLHTGGDHHECTEETKKKISESKKGKYCGVNNPNYGNHKLAGSNNPNYGKRWSEEWKEARRKEKKCFKIICIETGIIYDSLRMAEKLTGINHSSIKRVCEGKGNKAGGFKWKFIEEV